MSAGDKIRTLLRGVGQLLITAGVVILLFCVYELQITTVYANQQQNKLDRNLEQEWAAKPQGPLVPASAQGFARIYFPTLGRDQVHVVVEGVSTEDLKKGPGHYPGSDLPGELGNVVISGHRTTYGAPFNKLGELHLGDAIVLETRTAYFTYRVTRLFVVKPTAVGVTYRVPDQPDAVPTQKLMTLTTCHPKYSAKQRLIVRAELASEVQKGPGVVPPALDTGRGAG